MNGSKYTIMFIIFTLLFVGGFLFILNKIGMLSTDIQNLKLQLDISKSQVVPEPASTSTPVGESATSTSQNNEGVSVKIPTAILFETDSSPVLSPQTTLSITVQDALRNIDGTFTVDIKVFTSNASGYSAINPKDIFQVISFEGGNIEAEEVHGQFDSMPPKSATIGSLVFKTDPQNTNIILQVGKASQATFYEFNFAKKTYRETTVG